MTLIHDDVFRRLCRARDFMHERQADPLVLPELARRAGLSRFHFLRLFRDAFGSTPRQYLTAIRIERAKRLLAADAASVTQVCLDVGFSSLGSFSALFAERVGCPPSAFRRRIWHLGADQLVIPWCFVCAFAISEKRAGPPP